MKKVNITDHCLLKKPPGSVSSKKLYKVNVNGYD